MLTAKQICEVAEKLREMPAGSYAALSQFLFDAATEATEQALALEVEPDNRERLAGYAKGLRDAINHLHDLHSNAYREWPQVAQYLTSIKEREEDEEGNSRNS